MREDICSIPISEMFEPKKGCPLCRMHGMLEQRMVEYVTGAAMMEPDVRVETNRLGFCGSHLDQMCAVGNRLSIALILESHLKHLENECFSGTNDLSGETKEGVSKRRGLFAHRGGSSSHGETCFVCEGMEQNMRHLLENTAILWDREPDFRVLFSKQEGLCFPHCGQLAVAAGEKLGKKQAAALTAAAKTLAGNYLHQLTGDVSHFCAMFDYRNKNADWGTSRNSIERACAFLSGRMGGVPESGKGDDTQGGNQ